MRIQTTELGVDPGEREVLVHSSIPRKADGNGSLESNVAIVCALCCLPFWRLLELTGKFRPRVRLRASGKTYNTLSDNSVLNIAPIFDRLSALRSIVGQNDK